MYQKHINFLEHPKSSLIAIITNNFIKKKAITNNKRDLRVLTELKIYDPKCNN
jgi:hypothetical protein